MAFDITFLRKIRKFEYLLVRKFIAPNSRILEIGAGTGDQALMFFNDGFKVSAIDVGGSVYKADRVFDVLDYDGISIPFPTAYFDVVYSSNVLEHCTNLPSLHKEIKRVLKPGGVVIHVLPSGQWRFWTLISGYVIAVTESVKLFSRLFQEFFHPGSLNRNSVKETWRFLVKDYWLPIRHGEIGNAYSEIWYFSSLHWICHFKSMGFSIKLNQPMGIFYTGNMLFGNNLSLNCRVWLSRIVGSACRVYILIV
ncbi:class I SAM-dependent methyltransferase [Ferrovum sp. PN-J185]|uniref:class I SAM-dependent methyltransferase n=1 Tax=Ferrovum sp. PN-J185 TaxID=1356306 RepID=UPI000799265B|nr:class I SAM-dependent methyltransferase [Ferrovum sp. PN-J185]KXW55834.1 malonyl-[acyl-carrier protein] O-methyltransferase [Ferrovum sp. PN-J185]